MRLVIIVFALMIALLAAFFFLHDKNVSRKSQAGKDASEIRTMLYNYFDDIQKEGLEAEFRYLDNSSLFSWQPPGYARRISFDSVAVLIRANARKFTSVRNTWDTLHIGPVLGIKSPYRGDITSIVIDTAGVIDTFLLREEGWVIKKNGRWKLFRGKTRIRQ